MAFNSKQYGQKKPSRHYSYLDDQPAYIGSAKINKQSKNLNETNIEEEAPKEYFPLLVSTDPKISLSADPIIVQHIQSSRAHLPKVDEPTSATKSKSTVEKKVVNTKAVKTINQEPDMQKAKNQAVASLILGIISLFVAGIILGILAVVFGSMAAKVLAPQNGRGMAIAGVILGVVGILGALYFLAVLA